MTAAGRARYRAGPRRRGELDVAAARVESRLALVLSLLQQRQDLASDVVHEAGDGRAVGRIGVGGVGGREKGAPRVLSTVRVEKREARSRNG